MIQEKDIDVFLKAKRDALAISILQGLSLLSLLTLIVLEVFKLAHGYTVFLATMASVFMGGAMGQSRWVAVSRDQLVKTLEGIINTDPEALKLLAEKRSTSVSASKHTTSSSSGPSAA